MFRKVLCFSHPHRNPFGRVAENEIFFIETLTELNKLFDFLE
jgi:hypothetical protein